MVLLPSITGATQATVTLVPLAFAVTAVGAPGTAGICVAAKVAPAESPIEFVALMVNV